MISFTSISKRIVYLALAILMAMTMNAECAGATPILVVHRFVRDAGTTRRETGLLSSDCRFRLLATEVIQPIAAPKALSDQTFWIESAKARLIVKSYPAITESFVFGPAEFRDFRRTRYVECRIR